MKFYELRKLQSDLEMIVNLGWIENQRHGNDGGIGNTLEDLLGISENNYSLPDFGNWEIKSQRSKTASLLTLFHFEPEPRDLRVVPRLLLPNYGWPHRNAGGKYPITEKSFRQTIKATQYTDRGFSIVIDDTLEQIVIDFQFSLVSDAHRAWRAEVEEHVGVGALNPSPFWRLGEIRNKLEEKLKNIVYVVADTKIIGGKEFFKYLHFEVFMDPSSERFLELLKGGTIFIDFDARTGHNHGTKFRIRRKQLPQLYQVHVNV